MTKRRKSMIVVQIPKGGFWRESSICLCGRADHLVIQDGRVLVDQVVEGHPDCPTCKLLKRSRIERRKRMLAGCGHA